MTSPKPLAQQPSAREAAKAAVIEAVERNWQRQVGFLKDLIRADSVVGNEAGAQRLVKVELDAMGCPPDAWTVTDRALERWAHLAGSSPVPFYANRPNLAGTLQGAGGGRSLILNGHIDVVPEGARSHWSSDPWEPRESAGRLYGRGAADMKAGISALVFVGHALRDAEVSLDGDLTLMTVIEEECTGHGTLSAIDRGYRADAAIMPEPSGFMARDIEVAVLWARVTVDGRGAHAKNAAASVNAIQKAALLVQGVSVLQERANDGKDVPWQYAETPRPLNYAVGVIEGGDWASSVPAQCRFEVRFSGFPGESIEELRREFAEGLLEIAARDPWLRETPPTIEWIGFAAPGSELDRETELIQVLGAVHQEIHGRPMEFDAALGTSDQRLFLHGADMPATLYGPIGANQHAPDEWVDLQSVKQVTTTLALFAMEWCGTTLDTTEEGIRP